MKESQILSSFPAPASSSDAGRLVLDACHVGVVLRAVVFVEAVVAVAAMYGADTPLDWLMHLALATAGTLPATLLWLLAACAFKRWLARWSCARQQGVGVILGALAGLYGCAMLAWVGALAPPPWWASACSGALLSAALVSALVLRARGQAPAAATARLAELQARIRPHFLFNTLNSAIALVRAEPARAERLLEDLSDLFRYALAEPGDSVALSEEIELAQRYLAIEQVRFGERIQVEWLLDERASQARLPPLLLQPLVENAVKHGVESSVSGSRITVSTRCLGSSVLIRIGNTVGPQPARQDAGHGLALANVRERLRLLHDVQAQFRSGLKDGVYQVSIEVPL